MYISSTATRARRARRGGVHPTLRDAIPAGKKVPSARNFNCRVSDPRSHWPAWRGERSHWPARHAGPGISLFLFLSSRNCEEKSSGERGDAGECDSARKNNPRGASGGSDARRGDVLRLIEAPATPPFDEGGRQPRRRRMRTGHPPVRRRSRGTSTGQTAASPRRNSRGRPLRASGTSKKNARV